MDVAIVIYQTLIVKVNGCVNILPKLDVYIESSAKINSINGIID